MSQLEDDLKIRIYQKIKKWEYDALELYKMADLTPQDAAAAIISTLMLELILGAHAMGMTEKEMHETLDKGIKDVRRKLRAARNMKRKGVPQ